MIQKDLTILYYTSNTISDYFMKNTQDSLLNAVGDTPIVSVSFKPTVVGKNCTNIVVGEIQRSVYRMYYQVLQAAREAKTEFCATAEDDMLYHPSHFDYRPEGDLFAYNINKWSMFSWTEPPFFSYRPRMLMNSLIVRREALIKNLEERYEKYPTYDKEEFEKMRKYWGEPGRFDDHLGIKSVKTEKFESELPNVMFSTEEALGFADLGKRKAHSKIRADEIPYWGTAEEVLSIYKKK